MTTTTENEASEAPLTGVGSETVSTHRERDPYKTLDDLMSVVEALCPRWPPRENFRETDKILL
jgi:hypothetical protein